MRNFKLLLIPILFCLGIFKVFSQDVEVPFSWVSPSATTSSTGFWQCGSVNLTLDTGTKNHQLSGGTSARLPSGGPELVVPITLTFSKPVCNVSVLVRDIDELGGGAGSPNEWLEFIDEPLPVDVTSTFGGPPFVLGDVGGIWTADPNGFEDTEGWVNWVGPMTEVTFNYHRESEFWGMSLDSLRFDCDCSIPTNLSCCEGSDWQTLTWDEIPGVLGYEILFGFNDTVSGCCDSVTGFPYELLEEVTDNVFLVPDTFEDCFWWRVRSVMADGTKSEWSERMCDCLDEEEACEAPINLDCNVFSSGERTISWDPVFGALGYEVSKTYNDPTCCPGPEPESTVVTTTTNTFITEASPSSCYTWKVRTICTEDPTYSEWSEIKCSEDCTYPTAMSTLNNRVELVDGYQLKDSKIEVEIVPNPANDFVTLSVLGGEDKKTIKNAILRIINAAGQEVFRDQISLESPNRIEINDLKPGLYVCTIVDGENVLSSNRLIVK